MSISTASNPRPGVDRRDHLSPEAFRQEYLFPRRPVVITDALKAWKAPGRWTPEFFREKFPERSINVDGQPRPLGPFIDEVLASTPENPAPYFRNEELKVVFPELLGEVAPLPEFLAPNWLNRPSGREETKILHRLGEPEIYIGGAGQSFPVMHWDYLYTHAFLMQIYGRKQYYVFAPEETASLYPVANDPNRSQVTDVENPNLEKFPKFAQARGFSFLLEPGEALFVPCGWWHTVRMLTPSITISVNTANQSNWSQLTGEFCRLNAHTWKKRLQMRTHFAALALRNRLGGKL